MSKFIEVKEGETKLQRDEFGAITSDQLPGWVCCPGCGTWTEHYLEDGTCIYCMREVLNLEDVLEQLDEINDGYDPFVRDVFRDGLKNLQGIRDKTVEQWLRDLLKDKEAVRDARTGQGESDRSTAKRTHDEFRHG